MSQTAVALPNSSSTVSLPIQATVAPGETLSLPLSSLTKGVHYTLSCQIENPRTTPVDLRFEPGQAIALFGQVSLNEDILDNLQGRLQTGNNTLGVTELAIAGKEAQFRLRNLDFNQSVHISHCTAKPSIHPSDVRSGSFIFSNHTNHHIEIKVGNFFPTPYLLEPYSSHWISVSTDNQNIAINSVF